MLGVVTGLTAEARLAGRLGRVRAGGGSSAGAAAAADSLADEGATALLSFGLAGGLSEFAVAGTILVPGTVVTDEGVYETDPRLTAWLGGLSGGAMAASGTIVATRHEKRVLRQRTGADAVDMESGAIAAVARRRGLPFAVLRAVCDPAAGDLPAAALIALDARGAIGFARVLGSVARRPAQIPALLRLASQAGKARASLVRHAGGLVLPAPC